MIYKIQRFFEDQAFGVCTWWGEKLKVRTSQIRLFFIYASFLTFGSPIIIYLIMAFVLKMRNNWKKTRTSIWDL